jgi:hypothetical protein
MDLVSSTSAALGGVIWFDIDLGENTQHGTNA